MTGDPTAALPTGADRHRGVLVALDGPGGVGKSTTAGIAVDLLGDAGVPVHATAQPSRSALGELARHGTDTYEGMALACLCAADRHHQLATEIVPALRAGDVVVCDRYVASSLVLQGLDGIAPETVWRLNQGVYRPDLTVILHGDPAVIAQRLRRRGAHSRFERAPDGSAHESRLYEQAVRFLRVAGWPVTPIDATAEGPATIADRIVSLVQAVATEKGLSCR